MSITHLIHTYGYWAVFVIVTAEALGLPLPGETTLVAAGIYAGQTHRLSPWLVFAAAAAGALLGDNIGYGIGNHWGYELLRKHGAKVRIDERKLKIARYLFDRHGAKVVFFGRFVAILRTYAAFIAGAVKMRWRSFMLANASGGILWAGVFTVTSYFAGNSLERASTAINVGLGIAAVVAVIAGIVVVRHRTGRLAAAAEAAYPGPLT